MLGEELPNDNLSKILVIIDLPKQVKFQFGITDEDINIIVTNSIAMIVKMLDDLISEKKGDKGNKDDSPPIYS